MTNYHNQIIQLLSYEGQLNRFQRLFFPKKVLNTLHQYTSTTPNPEKAFNIYSALSHSSKVSKDNNFFQWILGWIGKLCLSGLKRFTQNAFTQTVINLPSLTLETFKAHAKVEEKAPAPSIPSVSPKPPVVSVPPVKVPEPPQSTVSTEPPTQLRAATPPTSDDTSDQPLTARTEVVVSITETPPAIPPVGSEPQQAPPPVKPETVPNPSDAAATNKEGPSVGSHSIPPAAPPPVKIFPSPLAKTAKPDTVPKPSNAEQKVPVKQDSCRIC